MAGHIRGGGAVRAALVLGVGVVTVGVNLSTFVTPAAVAFVLFWGLGVLVLAVACALPQVRSLRSASLGMLGVLVGTSVSTVLSSKLSLMQVAIFAVPLALGLGGEAVRGARIARFLGYDLLNDGATIK